MSKISISKTIQCYPFNKIKWSIKNNIGDCYSLNVNSGNIDVETKNEQTINLKLVGNSRDMILFEDSSDDVNLQSIVVKDSKGDNIPNTSKNHYKLQYGKKYNVSGTISRIGYKDITDINKEILFGKSYRNKEFIFGKLEWEKIQLTLTINLSDYHSDVDEVYIRKGDIGGFTNQPVVNNQVTYNCKIDDIIYIKYIRGGESNFDIQSTTICSENPTYDFDYKNLPKYLEENKVYINCDGGIPNTFNFDGGEYEISKPNDSEINSVVFNPVDNELYKYEDGKIKISENIGEEERRFEITYTLKNYVPSRTQNIVQQYKYPVVLYCEDSEEVIESEYGNNIFKIQPEFKTYRVKYLDNFLNISKIDIHDELVSSGWDIPVRVNSGNIEVYDPNNDWNWNKFNGGQNSSTIDIYIMNDSSEVKVTTIEIIYSYD